MTRKLLNFCLWTIATLVWWFCIYYFLINTGIGLNIIKFGTIFIKTNTDFIAQFFKSYFEFFINIIKLLFFLN